MKSEKLQININKEKNRSFLMRNIIILLTLCITINTACQDNTSIKGKVDGDVFETIYLYEIDNLRYRKFTKTDSSAVTGGKFQFDLKDKSSGIYYLGNESQGAVIFVEPGLVINGKMANNQIKWNSNSDCLHKHYQQFIEEKNQIIHKRERDSLNTLFNKAKKVGDRAEMKRIKNESSPYYSNLTYQKVDSLVSSQVRSNMNNLLGMYLYKTYQFSKLQLYTSDEIERCQDFLDGFDHQLKESEYMKEMLDKLDRFTKCSVGAIAPEIVGRDTLDIRMKLSDYRGQYVIVDFWSSGCKYCRWETPNLRKALEKYRDRGLTILGVSSDWKKDRWLKAIEEDQSYWNHIKLDKKDIRSTMDAYCINGIPHIILLDPEGRILAKDIRGDDIYNTPEKFIK